MVVSSVVVESPTSNPIFAKTTSRKCSIEVMTFVSSSAEERQFISRLLPEKCSSFANWISISQLLFSLPVCFAYPVTWIQVATVKFDGIVPPIKIFRPTEPFCRRSRSQHTSNGSCLLWMFQKMKKTTATIRFRPLRWWALHGFFFSFVCFSSNIPHPKSIKLEYVMINDIYQNQRKASSNIFSTISSWNTNTYFQTNIKWLTFVSWRLTRRTERINIVFYSIWTWNFQC